MLACGWMLPRLHGGVVKPRVRPSAGCCMSERVQHMQIAHQMPSALARTFGVTDMKRWFECVKIEYN